MNKPGYTLIELSVVILISSILAIMLFRSVTVINRITRGVEAAIDFDMRMALIGLQMERDLSGAFVPLVERGILQKRAHQPAESSGEDAAAIQDKNIKPRAQIFYAQSKEKNLENLTFITNNPIAVYQQSKNSSVNPRMVRVRYRLELGNKSGRYTLYRQESTQLDIDGFNGNKQKTIREFVVADNIKEMKLSCMYPVYQKENKEKKKNDAAESQSPVRTRPVVESFKTVTEWPDFFARKTSSIPFIMPQYITLQITLWDELKQQERTMNIGIIMAAFEQQVDQVHATAPTPEVPKNEAQPQKSLPSSAETAGQSVSVVEIKLNGFKDLVKEVRTELTIQKIVGKRDEQ